MSEYILISQLCTSLEVEASYFELLNENGLIQIEIFEEKYCIHQDKLPKVEKIIRLQQNLNLNIEGVDVVFNLLDKIEEIQSEVIILRNKLKRYE